MRRWSFLACILLVLTPPLHARGQGSHAPGFDMDAGLPLHQNELVRVVDHPEDRLMEFVIGPVSLPAGGPHLRPPIQFVRVPARVWVHGFRWEMRDASGAPLSNRIMHHFNLIRADRRELFSPTAQRLVAAGPETGELMMPRLIGIPVEQDEVLLVVSMFAPEVGTTHEEAYLHVWLSYTPHREGLLTPRDVYPFYLDVMGPVGDKDFPLPSGSYERSWEATPAVSGRLLALGAHMHTFAERLVFEDVTSGRVLWEVSPDTDSSGTITGIEPVRFWWRGGIWLAAGHTYRVTVWYENPVSGPAPYDGMGTLGGLIAPEGGRWPAFDGTDASYRQDIANILSKPHESHSHGASGDSSSS